MVEVINWNPYRRVFSKGLLRFLPYYRKVNNFGDLIGPLLVEELKQELQLQDKREKGSAKRLLTVGSILHFAQQGDVIWGTGVNGKITETSYNFTELDVRAVRGPLTREFLLKRSIACPEVYGDPGLVLVRFLPEVTDLSEKPGNGIAIIPNFNDFDDFRNRDGVINPRLPLFDVVESIAKSEFVIASSLHGIVIAESLGIPAQLLASRHEPRFKYEDYYLGTERDGFRVAETITQAMDFGGEKPFSSTHICMRLLNSFPTDLWA